MKYLLIGELFANPTKARTLKTRAACFVIIDDSLYMHAFFMPLLKYLNPREAQQALEEVHESDCGKHLDGRSIATKVIQAGFFWPILHRDAFKKV